HKQLTYTLRILFDKAFSGATSLRPSAKTWATAIYEYAQPEKQQMVFCQKDKNNQHFAGYACVACG
ncbi:DNA-binding protein, partial [Proteus vulgaris]|uniref:hypothetical protein n=1 Tax=Proteus vulgaris TaxID=585 RepID=UPI00258248E8|nr:DNA-binding protein [Proteus vulgaris]